MANEIHEEELQEFIIFTDTNKDGVEVELAVVDEFDVDGNTYVAAALVDGDSINPEGVYLYKATITDDEFIPEKITDEAEFDKVSQAYVGME